MATQAQPRQQETAQRPDYKWAMVIDLDRCTGCQACVIACDAENNTPIPDEQAYKDRRVMSWIRVERYWEGEYPDVKARYLPVLCQHCDNAPCEPVCPVYATYHNNMGLNVQVYNRCVGTRYCANNCPYHARRFNYWQPEWPDELQNQLNSDVTVRSRGIMEKCTFCIQRIRRVTRGGQEVEDGSFNPACVQACPTSAMTFGNINDPNAAVTQKASDERNYQVLERLGTVPSVIYLKKVEADA